MHRFTRALRLLGAIGLLAGGLSLPPAGAAAQGASHYFPETKHTVAGVFWTYWQGHGGLAQQGFPISDECRKRAT